MQTVSASLDKNQDMRPWYAHRWPWLLMLGPVAVILAGIHTTMIAFAAQDALVVDDYYKQGKAINMDLRRDRVAADMRLEMDMSYDAAKGVVNGSLSGLQNNEAILLSLVHSTQPEKDIKLRVQPDAQGRFSATVPMLDIARWQVLVENEQRDWRLLGSWNWPQERRIAIKAS
ncbi:FixH family protein [Oxalobacteraceae bacterium R-40]|uniref:FixH family protein n=1 Tax=Keguizhuia sedimenti TaxID=3064264 RepID=A0ABU1BR78_9BURK|nr:FixH family protein [Oxalobacteraceae bacterium R-40]